MYSLDLLSVTSQILIGFSLLFGVVLLYQSFIRQRYKARQDRKQYTIELCLSDNRIYENIFIDGNIPYYKQIEKDRKTKTLTQINEVLAYFEKIAIGLNEKIYDEAILRKYYEKYFIMLYRYYKYYIMDYRENHESPFLYIEFEKYVMKWSESLRSDSKLGRMSNEW